MLPRSDCHNKCQSLLSGTSGLMAKKPNEACGSQDENETTFHWGIREGLELEKRRGAD